MKGFPKATSGHMNGFPEAAANSIKNPGNFFNLSGFGNSFMWPLFLLIAFRKLFINALAAYSKISRN
jgi:hypothetical protein